MKKHLTMKSTIGELYDTPIGHDVLRKVMLQAGISEKIITNPVVRRLPLSSAAALSKKLLDKDFWNVFLHLAGSEQDTVVPSKGPVTHQWWKEAVFYQIYPMSFCDSDHDGTGDLNGIISKLDYLKDLGIDALWLSPVYDSPNDDNGYDIRDYRKIQEAYGDMETFDTLLAETHKRGMKLIMDLVVNHTSDEHEWFQKALHEPESPYHDYYFLRNGEADEVPNNWISFFSGSAWNYYPEQKVWGLHLFSKKQMDLNWDNPAVRSDVIDMINFWLDKGVDGFRMDVINFISKDAGLPEGNESIGKLMQQTGIEHYYYGPHLHEYLREIHERAFAPHNAFSVGETPGVGLRMGQLITDESRGELDMIFSFDHLESPGHVRFEDYRYDLNYFRDYITEWLENYGSGCWMSLFWNNHDNPRMISKINPDPAMRQPLARLLAVMQMTLPGTPFLFQGDEMGLVNVPFRSIEEITDVESKGKYAELCAVMSPEEAFAVILAGTREHTRIPLPWNEGIPEHLQQTIDTEVTDMYRDLIALRKKHSVLVYGSFEVLNKKKNRFTYRRADETEEFIIDCNLSAEPVKAALFTPEYEPVMPANGFDRTILPPYGARIWKKR